MIQHKSVLITPDGEIRPANPSNGEFYTLQEMYSLVGCELVEPVFFTDNGKPYCAIVDENGKLFGKRTNEVATKIIRENGALFPGDYLVGNVLICERSMMR